MKPHAKFNYRKNTTGCCYIYGRGIKNSEGNKLPKQKKGMHLPLVLSKPAGEEKGTGLGVDVFIKT